MRRELSTGCVEPVSSSSFFFFLSSTAIYIQQINILHFYRLGFVWLTARFRVADG